MSYERANLHLIGAQGSRDSGGGRWVYVTTDTLETVLGANYFGGAAKILRTNDLLEIKHPGGWASSIVEVDSGQAETVAINIGGGSLFPGSVSSGQAPLPSFARTVISEFRSGHGYTKQSGGGTQTDDTTDHLNGSQSLQLTTDGDGVAVFSDSGAITLDTTGKSLYLIAKTSDVANTSELVVYLTGDNFANFWILPFDDATSNFWQDDEWTVITLNAADWTTSGSPARSGMTKLRLRVKDSGSAAISVNFAVVGTMPEPTAGALSITFDDGWSSQYSEAKKKMSEYSLPGVAYVIKEKVGTSGYMTLANLRELENYHGWEIAAHHGVSLASLSIGDAELAIKEEKSWLVDNGFTRGVDHLAMPNGVFNSDLLALYRKYFRTSRTIAGTTETFPAADWSKLRVLNVLNSTTTGAIATAIDNARTNKAWLILVFHKIVASPSVSTEYSITNFGTVIDDIAADGIAVKTISDAIATL